MTARLASGVMVAALLRRVAAEGGFGTVLNRGDATAGAIAVVTRDRGETRLIEDWPGARCNRDFCALSVEREGRQWQLLIGRGTDYVAERALAAACERADIVIAPRYLPYSCHPRWIKADRRMLDQSGGLTIDLTTAEMLSVADDQGQHGWWKPPADRPRLPKPGTNRPNPGTTPPNAVPTVPKTGTENTNNAAIPVP